MIRRRTTVCWSQGAAKEETITIFHSVEHCSGVIVLCLYMRRGRRTVWSVCSAGGSGSKDHGVSALDSLRRNGAHRHQQGWIRMAVM